MQGLFFYLEIDWKVTYCIKKEIFIKKETVIATYVLNSFSTKKVCYNDSINMDMQKRL